MARTTLSLPFSGVKLRTLRETAGLFQADLADLCTKAGVNLDHARISRYESGAIKPTPKTLKAMADALNAQVDDLLDVA